MDLPIREHTATVVSHYNGDASLYSTSDLGFIGSVGHESLRAAARDFVKAAEAFHDDSVPTSEFPYPTADRVRFYLVTLHGVRVIDTDLASIMSRTSKYVSLFAMGQNVLTEQVRLLKRRKP